MKLISVEDSRIVSLVGIQMNKGQPYLPDLVAALVERYGFLRFPSTYEEIVADKSVFAMGKWQGVQIEEMTTYSDGIIVRMKTSTSVSESFIDDLYNLALEKFGLERVSSPGERRLFESAVVVQFEKDVAQRLSFTEGLRRSVEGCLSNYGAGDYEYQPGSFQLDADATQHAEGKPIPFSLVRRVRTPFDDNIWFSSAPLRTDDHVETLRLLDA